jgi:hypothetical protein
MRGILQRAVLLAVVLVCLSPSAVAAESEYGREAGFGVLAVTTNLFYMPTKLVYAVLGGVTGSLAFLLTAGNTDVAHSVWSPSLGGTYVVTPAMLRSEEPILFSGASHSAG